MGWPNLFFFTLGHLERVGVFFYLSCKVSTRMDNVQILEKMAKGLLSLPMNTLSVCSYIVPSVENEVKCCQAKLKEIHEVLCQNRAGFIQDNV